MSVGDDDGPCEKIPTDNQTLHTAPRSHFPSMEQDVSPLRRVTEEMMRCKRREGWLPAPDTGCQIKTGNGFSHSFGKSAQTGFFSERNSFIVQPLACGGCDSLKVATLRTIHPRFAPPK